MKRILGTSLLVMSLGAFALADESATNAVSYSDGAIDRRFGVGLMLGEPIGASLKYRLDDHFAIDGGVGVSLRGEDNLHLHSDVLYHFTDVISVSRGSLPIYFGGGVRYKFRDNRDDLFGFRIPAGIAYLFEDIPVDVFFEVAPVLDVHPSTDWEFTAGIGARYWF
ncbi:MAG TPA: hypothetical protein VJW76_00910 [Verrucomicrobiae bacterium]|nr:hypothetical protein [Verrucomicrobiae bacterium]